MGSNLRLETYESLTLTSLNKHRDISSFGLKTILLREFYQPKLLYDPTIWTIVMCQTLMKTVAFIS